MKDGNVISEKIVNTYKWSEPYDEQTQYEFPYGEKEAKTVTTVYTNTANVYIKEATTWCMDLKQDITLTPETVQNEVTNEYSDTDLESYMPENTTTSDYPDDPPTSEDETRSVTDTYVSECSILYKTITDLNKFTCPEHVEVPKKINYERFLGLWKNKRGVWGEGEDYLFDKNGEEVRYGMPGDPRALDVVVDKIADFQGQTIGDLLALLELHDDTETQEQLMEYYWNIYYGVKVYDADENEIFDLFDKADFISTGSSYGTISINGTTLEKDEFIEAVKNHSTDQDYYERFAQYADVIYDTCVRNNINPVICVAVAKQESNFGNSTPANTSFNYWGIGVYNDSNTGESFESMEAAVERWCGIIKGYQTPGTRWI